MFLRESNVLKKRNYPEEELPVRSLITYITLDISYYNDKKVRIRKIHKDIETDELKKSKYKIDDDETYIYDNQIDLDMFSVSTMKSRNEVSEGYLNLDSEGYLTIVKNLSRFGIDIYVSMKNLTQENPYYYSILIAIAAIILTMIITYIIFLGSGFVIKALGSKGMDAFTRVMGLLTVAIAVQFMFLAIEGWLKLNEFL
jgi:hypothetical protein